MNLLTDISPIAENSKLIRVLVECEKGSVHKYEYDPRGVLTVVRDLNKKYKYPYNYGCIPSTLAGDNDPLDAIIISNESFIPTTVLNCQVIGMIKMIDNGEEDNKILCIPSFNHIKKIKLKKILKYLNNYKYPLQDGTELVGVYNQIAAWEEINRCILR